MTDLDAIHDPHAPLHEWGSMEIAQYIRNRAAQAPRKPWWRIW
jgi:hypothetical protein